MANITIKEMLDAGVHFGHQTQRWNPKMKPYVFGDRGGIHIIDLQKSVLLAQKAADFVRKSASEGKRLIFVGTKKQAVEPIQEAAKRSGQYFVTKRWLGGTLTNFTTIKEAIDRLRKIDVMKEKGEYNFFNKKERAKIDKEYDRLLEHLEGIREMKDLPQIMFVVDLKKEHIAIAEAKRLGIPVVGIADSNSDPEEVEFPIPGNDDAIRSISLFTNLVADAFLEGTKEWESVRRTQSDKQSDVQKETAFAAAKDGAPEKKGRAPARGRKTEEPSAPPQVIKVSKRKLVAAGTAEDVEISAEIESGGEETAPKTDS